MFRSSFITALGLTLVGLCAPGCYRVHTAGGESRLDAGFRLDGPRSDGPDPRPDVPLPDAPRTDPGSDPCASIDCPPPPVDCAFSFCRDGLCFVEPIAGACPPATTCDFARGCVSSFDAGPPRDAGLDAPVLLRDAPTPDAPRPDAPPPDAPRPDAPPPDAPRPDAPPPDAPPPDAPRIDAGPDAGPPTSEAFRCTPTTRITVNDRTVLSVGPEMTLELWVRARGPGSISGKGDATGRRHFILRLEPGSDGAMELVGGWTTGVSTAELRVPFAAFMGRYTHVALVQRLAPGGVRVELWVDAVLAGAAVFPDTTSGSFNDVPLLLCQLDADLDEVRIWSNARPQALIAAFRFGTVATDSPGLLAYWPLESTRQIQLDRTLLGSDAFLGTSSVPDPADPLLITAGAF